MLSPNFNISGKILTNIGIIEACKEIITTAPLVPAWEKEFQSQAAARTIHYGTHLEGNDLSFDQAKRVIEGEKIVARDRDIWEVINYRNVLHYIEKIGDADKKDKHFHYTQDILKGLHRLTVAKILDKQSCGDYRRVKVVIKDSGSGEVIFVPISPI